MNINKVVAYLVLIAVSMIAYIISLFALVMCAIMLVAGVAQ